jgi:outer membrane protein assembly factor BamD
MIPLPASVQLVIKGAMRWIYLIPVMWMLAACGGEVQDEPADTLPESETVEVLYERALSQLKSGKFKGAIESFEEVERQHPYSEWASRAQVMAAYAAYRAGEYIDAQGIIDRFVRLHPTHASTPYAYYLRALSYYIQITDVGRDQRNTSLAREALNDVIARYPDSVYARDARLKLDLTNDHLAGKEMEIGRYYLHQQEYVSAINRFKVVVNDYETTSHTAEALHRLVEAYMILGVVPEAKRYAAVLGHNFPGSEWYQFSYRLMQGDLSPEERESTFDQYLSVDGLL